MVTTAAPCYACTVDIRGEDDVLELDLAADLPVRAAIDSLVRKVLENREDLFDTLLRQVLESKNVAEHLDDRWGDLSVIAQTKLCCDIGYQAWVLTETGLGDDNLDALSFG
jgi:hypothetical protein